MDHSELKRLGKVQLTLERSTSIPAKVNLQCSTLPVQIGYANEAQCLTALVDSASAVILISCDLINELCLPTVPSASPLQITAVNNQPIGDGYLMQQTVPISLKVGLFHKVEISFFVITLPCMTVILGFPWLHAHD